MTPFHCHAILFQCLESGRQLGLQYFIEEEEEEEEAEEDEDSDHMA